MEKQVIELGDVVLEWHEWVPWEALKLDTRFPGGIKVPNYTPGVYEAKHKEDEKRLTIGKTTNLRMRIKQGLVKGKTPHSSGKKIRANEDTSTIIIRWAETSKPEAVEEELHRIYTERFGEWPKYVDHT